MDLYTNAIIPTAKAYNFTLLSENSTVLHEGSAGKIKVGTVEAGLAPAPVTPVHGPAWELFGWASKRVFEKEGEEGLEVIVAPSAATGNTLVFYPS